MSTPAPSRWVSPEPQPKLADRIAHECNLSPVTAQVLVNRGIRDPETADRFLKPSLSQLEDPSLLSGISEAADRIRAAVAAHERILIFGDYDVDGITASTLLYRFLKICRAECDVYLPSRLEEGYGLSDAAAAEILRRKPDLVVTVDCGIRSVAEVAGLRAAGIDVIVTDHHEPGADVPEAVAVIDPVAPTVVEEHHHRTARPQRPLRLQQFDPQAGQAAFVLPPGQPAVVFSGFQHEQRFLSHDCSRLLEQPWFCARPPGTRVQV